jgi:two-component system response regulator
MQQHSILLVEDNPDDEALAVHALKKGRTKNEFFIVRDGQEALDYLFCEGTYSEREKINPQVVLLDLKLPKVDGIDVLRKIREHQQTKILPVVILTSSRQEKDVVATYSLGANSYIVKPVDIEQFFSAIGQLQVYWLSLNERPF